MKKLLLFIVTFAILSVGITATLINYQNKPIVNDEPESNEGNTANGNNLKEEKTLDLYGMYNENDIETCLQVVIYAYLMEHRESVKLNVSGGQYRYLRQGKNVDCKYDDAIKDELNKKLTEFKSHLDTGDFPISNYAIKRDKDDPDPCRYCKYGLVCGKQREGGSDDE